MSDDEKLALDEDALVATSDMANDIDEENSDDNDLKAVADEETDNGTFDEAGDESADDIVTDDEEETEEVSDEKPQSEAQKRHEERLARHASKHAAQDKHAARQERHAESKKDKKSDSGKKKFGLWRWIKAIFLELKKVTWPSFPKVVKTTAVVLGIVIFFLAVLALMDAGLGFLFRRMVDNVFPR